MGLLEAKETYYRGKRDLLGWHWICTGTAPHKKKRHTCATPTETATSTARAQYFKYRQSVYGQSVFEPLSRQPSATHAHRHTHHALTTGHSTLTQLWLHRLIGAAHAQKSPNRRAKEIS